ncbi:MAG TPA: hypothetical protein VKN14_04060, partial [Flavobacteriaceae bacterium]|nr:hypothetical protein [Flavobacteriaceae bacterium]
MKRRNFLEKSLLTTLGVSATPLFANSITYGKKITLNFKLKFAPHSSMFKHHAGDDILDQIQ